MNHEPWRIGERSNAQSRDSVLAISTTIIADSGFHKAYEAQLPELFVNSLLSMFSMPSMTTIMC